MTTNRIGASLLLVTAVAGSVALAACGGAEGAPAKAPAGAGGATEREEREPTSVAEAQDQIDRARAELESDGVKKAEKDKDAATSSTTPGGGTTSPTSPSSTTAKPGVSRVEEANKASAYDSCSHSCRALSSMRRAVSALCRMTGDTDNRCSDARRTLQENESKVVAQCHCSA